jgi:hypothetical protein
VLVLGVTVKEFRVHLSSQLQFGDTEGSSVPDPDRLAAFLDRVLEHLNEQNVRDADFMATLARGAFEITFLIDASSEAFARNEARRVIDLAFDASADFPLYFPDEALTTEPVFVERPASFFDPS